MKMGRNEHWLRTMAESGVSGKRRNRYLAAANHIKFLQGELEMPDDDLDFEEDLENEGVPLNEIVRILFNQVVKLQDTIINSNKRTMRYMDRLDKIMDRLDKLEKPENSESKECDHDWTRLKRNYMLCSICGKKASLEEVMTPTKS